MAKPPFVLFVCHGSASVIAASTSVASRPSAASWPNPRRRGRGRRGHPGSAEGLRRDGIDGRAPATAGRAGRLSAPRWS
jgi:hypothetical protein